MAYETFQVLIDDPSSQPGLNFDRYGSAFAEIVRQSKPQFAVGIFGTWGSGKTTLMRAIESNLRGDGSIVSVWFNAWRYEREDHLIVPLLDSIREELVEASSLATPESREILRSAARQLVRAGKAILAGLSLSASLKAPLVGEIKTTLDTSAVIASLEASDDPPEAALSFYHSAFNQLRTAISSFSEGGRRRVVVFVDDLDRCLPEQALQVLESMKLFFDIEGCIFVVGLDDEIVARAIAWRYRDSNTDNPTPIEGAEYIKKVFQVPFQLPRIGSQRLHEYLEAILSDQILPDLQAADIRGPVRRHLRYLQGDETINPREIKRLLNAYVLQLKILSVTIGHVNPDVVLALQSLYFRPEWRASYDALISDPELVQLLLKEAVETNQDTIVVNDSPLPIPMSLRSYLTAVGQPLLETPILEYATAAEATSHTNSGALEAQIILNRLQKLSTEIVSGNADAEAFSRFEGDIYRLESSRSRYQLPRGNTTSLLELSRELAALTNMSSSTDRADGLREWGRSAASLFTSIQSELREIRRTSSLSAYA